MCIAKKNLIWKCNDKVKLLIVKPKMFACNKVTLHQFIQIMTNDLNGFKS